MQVDPQEVTRRMRRFEEACRRSDIKLTHQRSEVFREVAGNSAHPDAETVYRGVRQRLPSISLDTVYRTLRLLVDMGQVAALEPPRQKARFDANLDRHHHFLCKRCGLTQDFYSDELDGLRLPGAVDQLGRIETTHVEARGLCRSCLAGEQEKNPETGKGEV